MVQCNSLNKKFSNSEPDKLKSGIRYGTEVTLNLSSNVIGDSNGKTIFPYKLLLTDRYGSGLRKANNSSANIKLLITQLSKIVETGGFLERIFEPLLKTGLPLLKNALKLLAKSILISLGLTAAASQCDVGIHTLGKTALIISNEEMEDIMKIVKSLEESSFLIRNAIKTIENEPKEKEVSFQACYEIH